MRFKTIVIGLLLGLLLSGCMLESPLSVFKSRKEKDKERVNVLLKRNKDFVITDTIRYIDTITTEKVEVDTVFKQRDDTVYIVKENLKIKYKYNTKTDSVFIDGKCDTVKIYIDKPVKVPVIDPEAIKSDCSIPWWIWLIIGCLGFLLVFVIIKK